MPAQAPILAATMASLRVSSSSCRCVVDGDRGRGHGSVTVHTAPKLCLILPVSRLT